jgi:hypothetical protein
MYDQMIGIFYNCGINLLLLIDSAVTAAMQIVLILKILFMSVFRWNEIKNISNIVCLFVGKSDVNSWSWL